MSRSRCAVPQVMEVIVEVIQLFETSGSRSRCSVPQIMEFFVQVIQLVRDAVEQIVAFFLVPQRGFYVLYHRNAF